ncbi:MAG: hypothetical protein AB8H79_12445 [Myxococcota bacterium]
MIAFRWLLAVLVLCLSIPSLAQQPAVDTDTDEDGIIDNIAALADPLVRIKVTPVADGIARNHEWSTMHVRLANLGEPLEGTLVVNTRTGSGENLAFSRRVELPAGVQKEVHILYKPGMGGASRTVEWIAGTRSVAAEVPIRWVDKNDVAIGVIGEEAGGVQAISSTWSGRVPARQTHEGLDADTLRDVRVGLIPVFAVPERVQGLDSLNWLIWMDADPSKLTPEQVDAVRGWVAGGGHLLVTTTTKWRQLGDGPLADLLPVTLEGVRDGYGSWAMLGNVSTDGGTLAPQAMARPRTDPERHVEVLTAEGSDAIWTMGRYGLGTVHVLAVDPLVAPLRSGMDREVLWRRLLWLPEPGASALSPVPLSNTMANAMNTSVSLDEGPYPTEELLYGSDHTGWWGKIHAFLIDIPGVAPIPMTWLLAFAAVYLVVIGPLDYFVLRSLRRQPLTWITFPVSIAIFSGLALLGTSYVKGSQAVVTRYEVVDILPDTGLWRGTSWYGVWSTRSTSLSMTSGVGDGLAEPLEDGGYQKAVEVVHGTAGTALKWDADTWTLSFVRTTWTEQNRGALSIRRISDDSLELRNASGFDLADAVVMLGNDEVAVGDLPDGDTRVLYSNNRTRGERLDYQKEALSLSDHNAWARTTATFMPETRRGTLRHDAFDAVVLGIIDGPVEQSILEGLTPNPRTLTVLRAPLTIPGMASPEQP